MRPVAGHFVAAVLVAGMCMAGGACAHRGSAVGARPALQIPAPVAATSPRAVTVEDLATLRHIDTLSISPDGQRYAMFVRQADPAANDYRTAWFVGATDGGALTHLGDGGVVRPKVMYTGHMPGFVAGSESRWSPDGAWIAFTLRQDDAVQLWRSRADGGAHEQVTHNAADVLDFAWSAAGSALYFSVSTSRDELRAEEVRRAQQGYRYDEDLWMFTDLLAPRRIRALPTERTVWVVDPDTQKEQPASEAQRAEFGQLVSQRPVSPAVPTLAQLRDDDLRLCGAAGNRLVCARETAALPPHVAAIDPKSGEVTILADVNPEFRSIRLGAVERFEWDTPTLRWNEPGGALAGLYPSRTHGYVIYPPDFDPNKKYPVFIDPYMAHGFNSLGAEHPLHAYAAAGMIVLRMQFPLPADRTARGGGAGMKQLYSAELGFPHLTMLMESTLRGLDAVAARGFVDAKRVGIGGVSHGTFVPLYMLQKHDRIAALSMSSPTWGPMQYYWPTGKSRREIRAFQQPDDEWVRKPDRDGRRFWSQLDIADHVDAIEAPILMHLAAQETYALARLIRELADAGKPYDAYVFPAETHLKWQPAHLRAILQRNLDWFRFWLQDVENPAAAREQSERWRHLRELQCSNRRSLRDYCGAAAGPTDR